MLLLVALLVCIRPVLSLLVISEVARALFAVLLPLLLPVLLLTLLLALLLYLLLLSLLLALLLLSLTLLLLTLFLTLILSLRLLSLRLSLSLLLSLSLPLSLWFSLLLVMLLSWRFPLVLMPRLFFSGLLSLVLLTGLAPLISILHRSVRFPLFVLLTWLLLPLFRRLVFDPWCLAGLSSVNSLLVKDLVYKILFLE